MEELKHGCWLTIIHDGKFKGGKCSVCGKFKKHWSMRLLREQYKFCHRCGSKMDGDLNGRN